MKEWKDWFIRVLIGGSIALLVSISFSQMEMSVNAAQLAVIKETITDVVFHENEVVVYKQWEERKWKEIHQQEVVCHSGHSDWTYTPMFETSNGCVEGDTLEKKWSSVIETLPSE